MHWGEVSQINMREEYDERMLMAVCSLAYCEIYVMCALMAFKVIPRARLVDTTIEDVTYDHDLIVVQTKKGSVSVKIAIE